MLLLDLILTMGHVTASDWERLGRHVLDRRCFLGMSQADLAGETKLSDQRVRDIEHGRVTGVRDKTALALEQALRWPRGGVRRILDGEDPGAWDTDPPPTEPQDAEIPMAAMSGRWRSSARRTDATSAT